MQIFKPAKIYIDKLVKDAPLTETIVGNVSNVPVEYIDDVLATIGETSSQPDPISQGKKRLLITRYKGQMLKPCPGTPNVICCDYHVLNPVVGCPIDCTYCALQMYFNNPLITIYSNMDNLFDELDRTLQRKPKWLFRIGTGELTDSLALDDITGMSKTLVPYFVGKADVLFELKTKSDRIGNLLNLDHGGRTVVAWSLNPQTIIDKEEPGCASLAERLEAAQQCQQAGYKIAFHFDPLIYYSSWEEDYRSVVDDIFERINPLNIVWISLGTFRFPTSLKPIIKQRFPRSKIIYEEFVPGQDGKMRYLKPIRVDMYSKVISWIRAHDPRIFVYLCMESTDVWQKAFGWTPKTTAGLAKMFHS